MKQKKALFIQADLILPQVIIPWLKENFDYEVICVCIDCAIFRLKSWMVGRKSKIMRS